MVKVFALILFGQFHFGRGNFESNTKRQYVVLAAASRLPVMVTNEKKEKKEINYLINILGITFTRGWQRRICLPLPLT